MPLLSRRTTSRLGLVQLRFAEGDLPGAGPDDDHDLFSPYCGTAP
jgi:hypothetical protein